MLAHSLTVLLLLVLAAIIVHTGSAQGELRLERLPNADQLSQEASINEQAIASLFDRNARTSSVFYKSPKRMSICFCCRTFKCHRQPCPCSKYVF